MSQKDREAWLDSINSIFQEKIQDEYKYFDRLKNKLEARGIPVDREFLLDESVMKYFGHITSTIVDHPMPFDDQMPGNEE